MEDLKRAFVRYLKETLCLPVKSRNWQEAHGLPFFLQNLYTFFQVSMLDTPCLVMAFKQEEEQTPATIRKHMDHVQKYWEHTIIYAQRRVSGYNRKRLIEHKVPFVVPGNQMFLPCIGIDLREHFKTIRKIIPKWSPSTQVAFLFALHNHDRYFTPKALADQLGYTPMTMTRAFDELEMAELGEVAMEGRKRILRFDGNKRNLWERALKFLKTPVKKRLWVKSFSNEAIGVEAGLTALAHYSTLAEPPNPVFAMESKEWNVVRHQNHVAELPFAEPDACELEIWSYSPKLFAKDGVVDRLSLFLSLQGTDEERIEMALEEMMEQMRW